MTFRKRIATMLAFLSISGCDEELAHDDVQDVQDVHDVHDVHDAHGDLAGPTPSASSAVQSCDASYVPPAVWPPIDPVMLISGAASDCTTATANAPCAAHHVYTPNPARVRTPLFVFLPGTNMEPDKHDLVLMTAASTGYRSIGLSYDNTVNLSAACAAQSDCGLNCLGLAREEVVRGVDVSPVVDIARGDSILVRLYRLLVYLDGIDPNGGWSAYYVPTSGSINTNHIVWENIILGGFSQGAGHAAAISRQKRVHGLFLLDGANDTCQDPVLGTVPAEWTTGSDASAGRPKYGVRHDHGTGATSNTVTWEALGLGASLTNLDCTWPGCDIVDSTPPSVAASTAQGHPNQPPICSAHMSMARDACMPTDFGGTTAATAPADARLFLPYARRLCYACDASTCP